MLASLRRWSRTLISQALVRQGFVIPLGAMLVAVVTGLMQPGYSSLTQHLSELTVIDGMAAPLARAAAAITGASLLLFGAGLVLSNRPSRFLFTATASGLGGLAMLSDGVFVLGNPHHDLHGLLFFIALAPACFSVELGSARARPWLLAASAVSVAYVWMQMAGIDPHAFRGLTQRCAIIVMFGWNAVAGHVLMSGGIAPPRSSYPTRRNHIAACRQCFLPHKGRPRDAGPLLIQRSDSQRPNRPAP